ncbi:MAG: hypothetical protein HY319_26540 [Armatimonadetes bacterium]|nr:hypothetical protein [Armatimonadota bacterium]
MRPDDLNQLLARLEPRTCVILRPGAPPQVVIGDCSETLDEAPPDEQGLRAWLLSLPIVTESRLEHPFQTHLHHLGSTFRLGYQPEPLTVQILRPGEAPPLTGTRAHLDLLLAHAGAELEYAPDRPPVLRCEGRETPIDHEPWPESAIGAFLSVVVGSIIVRGSCTFLHRGVEIQVMVQQTVRLTAAACPFEQLDASFSLYELCLETFFGMGAEQLELKPGCPPRAFSLGSWVPRAAPLLTRRQCERLVPEFLSPDLRERLRTEGRLAWSFRLAGVPLRMEASCDQGWYEARVELLE